MIKKIMIGAVAFFFSATLLQPLATDEYHPTTQDDLMLEGVDNALGAMEYEKLKDIEMRLFVLLSAKSFDGRIGYFLDNFLELLNKRIEILEKEKQEEDDDFTKLLEDILNQGPVIQDEQNNVEIANEGESVIPTDRYLEKLLADYSPSTSNARRDFSLRIKNNGDTFLKNNVNLNIIDEVADIQCSVDGSGLVAARPVRVDDIQDIAGDDYFDIPMIVYPGHGGLNMDPKPFLRTTGDKLIICTLLMKNVSALRDTSSFSIEVIE